MPITIIFFLLFLFLGYTLGSRAERKHFVSLEKREQELAHIHVRTTGKKDIIPTSQKTLLVYGSVVIAQDYFKYIIFFIINIFGGRIRAYERMLERGRREALLRAKEQAAAMNANEIIHLRLDTSTIIINQRKGSGAIEVFAYGTAIKH